MTEPLTFSKALETVRGLATLYVPDGNPSEEYLATTSRAWDDLGMGFGSIEATRRFHQDRYVYFGSTLQDLEELIEHHGELIDAHLPRETQQADYDEAFRKLVAAGAYDHDDEAPSVVIALAVTMAEEVSRRVDSELDLLRSAAPDSVLSRLEFLVNQKQAISLTKELLVRHSHLLDVALATANRQQPEGLSARTST